MNLCNLVVRAIHAEPAEVMMSNQVVHVARMCCLCGQKRESLRQLVQKPYFSELNSFKVERAFSTLDIYASLSRKPTHARCMCCTPFKGSCFCVVSYTPSGSEQKLKDVSAHCTGC